MSASIATTSPCPVLVPRARSPGRPRAPIASTTARTVAASRTAWKVTVGVGKVDISGSLSIVRGEVLGVTPNLEHNLFRRILS